MPTTAEVRIAALEASSRVYTGAGMQVSSWSVLQQAKKFEEYIRSGKTTD